MADLEGIIAAQVNEQIHGEDPGDVDTGGTDEQVDAGDGGESTDQGEATTEQEVIEAAGSDEAKAEMAKKALEEAEEAFAKEHGLHDKAGKRENRIPYSRVKKIVENAQAKLAEMVLGGKIPEGKKLDEALKEFTGRIPGFETKIRGYEQELASVNQVGELMQSNPEKFLEILPHVNPKYRELLDARQADRVAERLNPGSTDEMPGPDLDLGNGAKTYSPAGLQKLLDWQAQQTQKRVLSEVEKSYKPIKDSYATQQSLNQMATQIRQKVENARTNWRGFSANEPAILKEVQGGLNLEDAYRKIMDGVYEKDMAAAKADREKMRKDLLEEISKAPKSTATSVSSRNTKAGTVDESESEGIESIIKKALEASRK